MLALLKKCFCIWNQWPSLVWKTIVKRIIFVERSISARKLVRVYFQKCIFAKCSQLTKYSKLRVYFHSAFWHSLFIWNMIWYLGTPQTLGRTKKGKLNIGSKCSEWICAVRVDLFLLLMKPVELPSMKSKVDDQGHHTGSLYRVTGPNHPSTSLHLTPTLHCSASRAAIIHVRVYRMGFSHTMCYFICIHGRIDLR